MNDERETKAEITGERRRGFLARLLAELARDAFKLLVAFAIGTGASAIACWYYDIPLVFSLLGGMIVLGLVVAFSTDSLFS